MLAASLSRSSRSPRKMRCSITLMAESARPRPRGGGGEEDPPPPHPAAPPRQSEKGGEPAEELVPAGAHQGDREPRLPDRVGHVIGVQAVEGRLVEAVERPIELRDE